MTTQQPDPPSYPPPVGAEWAVTPASKTWRTATGKRCRARAGPGHRACGAPSVAEYNRGRNRYRPPHGRTDSWWAYCAEHLADYARWVEDGQVMEWRARPCL